MFNYKVYKKDWSFKFTINPKSVKNEVKFSANENWWQWQMLLSLNYDFDNATINNSDFIKIRKWTSLIYTWICQKITRRITSDIQEINIPLLWLWTLPGYLMFFQEWGAWYSFTSNKDPSLIFKDVINWIGYYYWWWLSYDDTSIPLYWSNEEFTFYYTNCLEAMNDIATRIGWKWFIDKDWKVYFKPKDTSSSHNLTVWKDIEKIELSQDSEKLINNIRVEHSSWVNIYIDEVSRTLYWNKNKYFDKKSFTSAQADTFWNAYIEENKNPINKTTILVNKNYDIESIKVLENVTIKNFNYWINNLKIVKYQYSVDRLLIELEAFDSFWKELNL